MIAREVHDELVASGQKNVTLAGLRSAIFAKHQINLEPAEIARQLMAGAPMGNTNASGAHDNGKSYSDALDKTTAGTAAAAKASETADTADSHSEAASIHQKAAEAHIHAAEIARSKQNIAVTRFHNGMANFHSDMSNYHSGRGNRK
jgi:hypothetical protein